MTGREQYDSWRNPVTNRFEPPVRARDAEHGIVYRDDKEFFSHRRDNGITGRMAGVITARPG